MITLSKLVELAGEQAQRVLVEHGSNLMPTWLLLDGKGNLFVVGSPWGNDLEKKKAELVMRHLIREHKIVAYGFVVEAWQATKPAGYNPSDLAYVRPAQDPLRREVVMALATDGRAQEFRTWAIRRDYLEKVSALELLKENSEIQGNIFGWMTELLANQDS